MPWTDKQVVVSVIDCGRFDYPRRAPFHPPEAYAEYRYPTCGIDPDNFVYAAVRELLYELGFDRARFGSAHWNPLREIVRPGDNVIIKPNLVISEHEFGERGLLACVAHGSVIRPLIDYVLLANEGRGWVTICDSPIKEVDFAKITEFNGLTSVCQFFRDQVGADVRLLDLRDLQVTRNARGVMVAEQELVGDPLGYTVVDLGPRSLLAGVAAHNQRFRSTAAVYENPMSEAHTETVNLYSMSNTILRADCLIGVAKLKNHRKCGVTLSLKNMIGTTNEKRWLPHHRVGTPSQGGDICPDEAPPARKIHEVLADKFISHSYGFFGFKYVLPVMQFVYRYAVRWWARPLSAARPQADVGEGDWWGNDTIWRTTLDLNMVIRYADKQGRLHDTPQRAYLSVIDGILGGHREGPLHATAKECGILVGGLDPVAVDVVCSHMMGFDPERIRLLSDSHRASLAVGTADPAMIEVRSNLERWTQWREPDFEHLAFEPSGGWRGYVERAPHRPLAGGAPTSRPPARV
ncbi:MAG TPA: DUF362 domain-containing protein [Gemmatimonadales bacterium]|nr:DUF362 domain-containing protein [Gemmatimonadales bacterium]